MLVGKRKKAQAPNCKLIEWSDELRALMREPLSLQRTTSMYDFGNIDGQSYMTSGWNTNLRWLMGHARKKAEKEGIEFARFTHEGHAAGSGDRPGRRGGHDHHERYRAQQRPDGAVSLRQTENQDRQGDGIN